MPVSKDKRSTLEQIGLHALLPGLTLAADKTVELLNDLRAQLGMAPTFGSSGVFDLFQSASVFGEEKARLGRPPGSRPALALQNGESGNGGSTRSSPISQRWAVIKEAGMLIHGSPSTKDVERARKIITARSKSHDAPPDGHEQRKQQPKSKPRRTLSASQKNQLGKRSRYRWRTMKAAGLYSKGKLPTNELLAKAEKILAAMKEEKKAAKKAAVKTISKSTTRQKAKRTTASQALQQASQ